MSEVKLCDPCQKLLGRHPELSILTGQLDLEEAPFWDHHLDSVSLVEALQLPCSLCTLVWGDPKTTPGKRQGGTSYQITSMGEHDHTNARIIFFHYDEFLRNRVIAFVPLLDKEDSRYPQKLSESTGAPSAIGFLSEKYMECCKEHTICRPWQSDELFYPSRVLDVGSLGDAYIRLRDTRTHSAEGPYFCLSHRWGGKQPFVLTRATLPILQNGTLLRELPKTFRDAILVTRKFRVRYLWIDSLCIFQDDIGDWSAEARQMRLIYSHASCTIAATAATDGDGGLFFDRNSENLRPLRLHATRNPENSASKDKKPPLDQYWCHQAEPWIDWIENAPLNQRAWVAQERYLSRRIMHFTATQLFWECQENRASETYLSRQPHWATPHWFDDPMSLKKDLHDFQDQSIAMSEGNQEVAHPISTSQMYHSWTIFRHYYSKCAMTKEEDKLVALLGIADEFGRTLGDELVAGLWKNRFVAELWWRNHSHSYLPSPYHSKPSIWRAPTWSWLSSNDSVWCGPVSEHHWSCPQKDVCAELDHIDVETKPSGELRKASVRLKCKLLRATVNNPENPFEITIEGSNVVLECRADGHPQDRLEFFRDYEEEERTEQTEVQPDFGGQVNMVLTQCCRHDEPIDKKDESNDMAEGLLLNETSGGASIYERIGLFTVKAGENFSKLLTEHERAETRIITLV